MAHGRDSSAQRRVSLQVQNVGLLRAGHLHEVYLDVRGVVEASKPAPVKVILETASLKREEIAISSLISVSLARWQMALCRRRRADSRTSLLAASAWLAQRSSRPAPATAPAAPRPRPCG